jgi:hypothetical protein
MSHKAVSKAARAKAQQAAKKQSSQSLIGFVRTSDPAESLLQAIHAMDLEIAQQTHQARSSQSSPLDEERALVRLKELEIERFQLLGQVHGNRINDYLMT